MILQILLLWFGLMQPVQEEPARFKMEQPGPVKAGKEFLVTAVFDMEADWYIYAPTANNTSQGMIATKLSLQLPQGFRISGKPKMPAHQLKGSYEVYQGRNVRISQPVTTAADLRPGTYEIGTEIRFQTCNGDMCLAPRNERVKVTVQVQ